MTPRWVVEWVGGWVHAGLVLLVLHMGLHEVPALAFDCSAGKHATEYAVHAIYSTYHASDARAWCGPLKPPSRPCKRRVS